MRPRLLISSLIFLFACGQKEASTNSKKKNENKSWEISLKKTGLKINIALPFAYDTLFSWHDTRCHTTSFKYRIQNKKYPIYHEGCYSDYDLPFNKYQITFQEPVRLFDSIPNIEKEDIIKIHEQAIIYSKEDPQTNQSQYDTLFQTNDFTFSVLANIYHDLKNDVFIQTLETFIYFRRDLIKITFERTYQKHPLNRTEFINECLEVLKSLTTSNGS